MLPIPNVYLILGAACNSLNININILKQFEGNVKEIIIIPEGLPSTTTIHLLFTQQGKHNLDPNNITSHYNSIVLKKDTCESTSATHTVKCVQMLWGESI